MNRPVGRGEGENLTGFGLTRETTGGGGGGSFSIVVPDLEQGEVARCLIKAI